MTSSWDPLIAEKQLSKNPRNWLCSNRIVRFGETDAAGVIHFHQLFRWCHEAWEESLEQYGLSLAEIFPRCNDSAEVPSIGLPIVHCEADFRRPIKTGFHLSVKLFPKKIDDCSFHVQVKFLRESELLASGVIRHVCIDVETSKRCLIPEGIERWIEASAVNSDVIPL